jgi:hypothetical protein
MKKILIILILLFGGFLYSKYLCGEGTTRIEAHSGRSF